MKKAAIILLASTILAGLAANSSNYFSKNFLNRLSTCSYYSETVGARDYTSKSEISGWDNDKCVYKNEIHQANMTYTLECRFSREQIEKLVNTVSAESNTQYVFKDNSIKLKNSDTLAKIWNSYLHDKTICVRKFM